MLRTVGERDRVVLDRLFQLYQHDLSEFRGTWPDAEGRCPSARLGQWLELPGTVAYLVVAGARIGWSMGEFFVVRAARHAGVGSAAAREERVPVPGKPHLPPDTSLRLTVEPVERQPL
jgi:hypothetical protein